LRVGSTLRDEERRIEKKSQVGSIAEVCWDEENKFHHCDKRCEIRDERCEIRNAR
jgi:hypothetical protein